jgi:molybdenum cofactor cytidylyltransferase
VIFSAVPLDEAAGAVVAHTHRLGDRIIRKGSVLDEAAVAALRDAGRADVIAARMEPGDVAEDAAAARVAALLAAPGLSPGRAGTGRVNVHAATGGLLLADAATIDRINLVDPAVTVATLPDASMVAPKDMVATIKIIPFAVSETVLARVEEAANAGNPAFSLHPFVPLRVGLVLTELPGLKESVTEGTIEATRARVTALGGTLLAPLRCPHAQTPIAAACRQLLAAGAELLLVAGASATVDARDVGPAGVVAAGGKIVHFGMPVDPGNLICVGRIGEVPALVLPGCARSPKLNGIDFVLRRLFARLPAGGPEIMRMGVGGLLKDTDVRPLPRARAAGTPAQAAPASRNAVAAIVLAAGRSTRMAPYNKLLIPDRAGKAMVTRVVDNVLSSGARPVLVVTGHRADEIRDAIGGRPVSYVHAPDHADGLSASLRTGIAALGEDVAAAIVCLGDMPLVTGRIIDRLLAAYDPDEGRCIVVPTHGQKPGNPILWDRRYFPEILALSGDSGARSLLKRHMENVAEVEIGEDSVLRDFDTVESLDTLPARMRPEGVL